jgi:hypothetical protein
LATALLEVFGVDVERERCCSCGSEQTGEDSQKIDRWNHRCDRVIGKIDVDGEEEEELEQQMRSSSKGTLFAPV